MKKHVKHPPLTKPDMGYFGRHEWAILGTTCANIRALAGEIAEAHPKIKVAYVDASHDHLSEREDGVFHTHYLDRQSMITLSKKASSNNLFDVKQHFRDADLILINGNHFAGKRQILVLDSSKETSLKKRLSRLTNVGLIIRQTPGFCPDFIREALPGFDQTPIVNRTDTTRIAGFFRSQLSDAVPPVSGLVLAGGKSTRMGFDKGKILRHGQEARQFLYDLLKTVCGERFLSVREEQMEEAGTFSCLADRFVGLGPYGAILTAFQHDPDRAWLVVATDLLQADEAAFRQLMAARNPTSVATAFLNPETGFPDPLLTIWEPKAYARMLHFLSLGYSCPRKVLINSDVTLVTPKDPGWLLNVNTQEDLKQLG